LGETNYWIGPAQGLWTNASSWSNSVPTLSSDVWFTNSTARTVTNGSLDYAQSLLFTNGNHTLLGGTLFLGGFGSINVAGTRTATINSSLAGKTGLVKSGGGTLTLGNGTNLVVGGITVNAGTLSLNNTLALGNNAVNIAGGSVVYLNVAGTHYLREFGGAGTFNSVNYQRYVVVNALGDATYSGPRFGGSDHGMLYDATGPGKMTYSGTDATPGGFYTTSANNFWRGETSFGGQNSGIFDSSGQPAPTINLRGGILTIDESVADTNRLDDASPINVYSSGGGTLRYIGQANVGSAELVGSLQMNNSQGDGGGTIKIDVRPGSLGSATLTFASYAYNASTLGPHDTSPIIANFATPGTFGTDAYVKFTTAPILFNNVVRGGFVNGTDIATYDATKGIVPFNAVGGSAPAYVAPAGAASNNTVYANANHSLSADTTWNALKLDGSPTIDLNGKTLSLGASIAGTTNQSLELMVVKTGAGQAEIVNNGGGTKYLTTVKDGDHAYYVNEGTLKITAPLSSEYSTLRVNKAGDGLLWLAPTANWNNTASIFGGGIYFSGGAIRLDPDSGRFGNSPMRLNGGVMEIEGGGTYSPTIGTGNANLRWMSASGGFAAYGADATFSPNITWNAANHIPNGAALLLNSTTADSKITLSGILNLGTEATKMYLREIEVADNTGTNTDLAEISGQIISDTTATGGGTPTYTYHLVKTGAGTLSLTHSNNNYSGATYVKAGTLAINGKLAAPASSVVAVNPEYSAVTVMSGGTLGGPGTIDRVVRVQSGGTLSPGNSTGILTIGADTSLTNGATLRLEINGLTEGTQHDQLKLTAGDLVVSNSTLSLSWGTFSVTGDTNLIWIVNNAGGGQTLGQFSGYTNDASVGTHNGVEWFITYDGNYASALDGGNDVVLYAIIPEPSAWTLVGFGLFGAWVLGRRRRG
jgi:autotransporter-associated beta strand protein